MKVAFHSLGCKVNSYETDAMRQSLLAAGYEDAEFAPGADIYIINTCTVTNIADRKSRQMLHRAKEMNPEAIVVAAGCYVQDAGERLIADPAVDLIVGNHEKSHLREILEEYIRDRASADAGSSLPVEASAASGSGEVPAGVGSSLPVGVSAASGSGEVPAEVGSRQTGSAGIAEEKGNAGSAAPAGEEDMQPQPTGKSYVTNINGVREYDELHFVPEGEHTRAFIKIQDGCNQFCSYCMIPYVRGRVRSRQPGEILREITDLCGRGYQEFVLTGIHISSYGLDFDFPGENRQTPYASNAGTNFHLLNLIRAIAEIPGAKRIRLGSLEPGIITEEFVREISKVPELCPSFHLSLQSGCDATLQRMKRKYTTADYLGKCDLLRTHFDRPSITTDIITGFPGETEEEFAETEAFVLKVGFARTHIFRFSVRRGTAAEKMPGQNTERTKAERSKALLAIDTRSRAAYAESFVGDTVSVLFEDRTEACGKRMVTGYTREYVPVLMEAEEDLVNRILDVRAASATERGELLVHRIG